MQKHLDMDNLKSGKILRIHLKNFMCHSNFVVNLNKNTNVFVGLNGSGKSAILAAMTIGLGGNASSTARSTNLKDLVKQGTTGASIEITISNDGIDAFERKLSKIIYQSCL
jgi:structural maintenance of chromosomes protein 6